MNIELPDFALVLLMGASGSGKSTFAARHFLPTEILSSDRFRGMVSDDETSLDATTDAFDALHHLLEIRLRRRRLTVVDATNVQSAARKPLLDLSAKYYAVPVAIVLDLPERVCHERNRDRPDRQFGKHVVERHIRDLRGSLKNMRREGIRSVYHLDGLEQIEAATFTRVPLYNDRRDIMPPFDIIGDIHGCYDELIELLGRLGYAPDSENVWRHSAGRRAVFLGDLPDRGPKTVEVCNLVMDMVQKGDALCVPGNHDIKLMRALQGRDVQRTHGLPASLDQIAALPKDRQATFKERFVAFAEGLISHYWLDGGRLCVAHAGLKAEMIGRASGRVRDFALYGETTGETDEYGLPVRLNWATDYRGDTTVVYGHTPVPAPVQWLNNTLNIDTGCVFGGHLTALRLPEKEIVSVAAQHIYAEPVRPLTPKANTENTDADTASAEIGTASASLSLQWQHDDLLDIADFTGKRIVSTRLAGNVLIAEGNAAAALEVMSRYAVHPRWLIYLPPTMSPVETSKADGLLEHPAEAFAYFAKQGIAQVVCQEKHMGSRAVIVVCRNREAAFARFGSDDRQGMVVTRTGRAFFDDATVTNDFVTETARALEISGLWNDLATDWCCLDAEILPWNAKAQGLLREQYAPVARVALETLTAEAEQLRQVAASGIDGAAVLVDDALGRIADLEAYRTVYARYCWETNGLDGLQVAPFHLLAVEERTFFDQNHEWHIEKLARLAAVSPLFRRTETVSVMLDNAEDREKATDWWTERTANGAEGMVVKPLTFIPDGKTQPAVKVRGREYLRLIYGAEYTRTENLVRLRERGLGGKRALAAKEFALGVEALERFTAREPLRRVHECVFGVLALESEPIDPRL